MATKENVANKSDSYTASSSTTYASTKALVDGLATKQNTITNPITGTGTTGQVSFWNSASTQTGDNGLFWDNGNKRLGIGTTSPNRKLEVADIDSQLSLKGTITGAPVYQSWYNSSNVRRGYFGFPSDSNGTLRLVNEESGDIYITPINGSTIVSSTVTASNGTLIGGALTSGYIPKATGANSLGNSLIYDNGTNVGIGNSAPSEKLEVTGTIKATSYTGSATLTGTPTAPTATAGTNTTQIATTAFVKNGFVALTGNETIAGVKTFSSNILSNSLSTAGSDQLTLTSGSTSLIIDDYSSTIIAGGDIKATGFIRTTYLPGQLLKADGNVTVGYKVYTALLSQTGTSAPTATVLENTLGGTIVWTRSATGIYVGTLSGAFTVDKTLTLMNTGHNVNGFEGISRVDADSVKVQTYLNGPTYSDGRLSNSGASIEIRVYN